MKPMCNLGIVKMKGIFVGICSDLTGYIIANPIKLPSPSEPVSTELFDIFKIINVMPSRNRFCSWDTTSDNNCTGKLISSLFFNLT